MHYQIFLPETSPQPSDGGLQGLLTQAGLADHVEDAMPVQCPDGPAGHKGLLVGWLDQSRGNLRIEFKPEQQTWIESVPSDGRLQGAYWVGIDNSNPPTEQDLRRPYTRCGEWMELGDEKWKVPTPGSVEQTAVFNDDGSMRWVTLRSYAWLTDEAEKLRAKYLERFASQEMEMYIDPSSFIGWLVRLLRVNYRITPEVTTHLELWRDTQIADAVIASLGLQRKGGD